MKKRQLNQSKCKKNKKKIYYKYSLVIQHKLAKTLLFLLFLMYAGQVLSTRKDCIYLKRIGKVMKVMKQWEAFTITTRDEMRRQKAKIRELLENRRVTCQRCVKEAPRFFEIGRGLTPLIPQHSYSCTFSFYGPNRLAVRTTCIHPESYAVIFFPFFFFF